MRSEQRGPVRRLSMFKKALLVFVLLAFMYGYYYHNPGANGNSRLGLVFALVQLRRATIDIYYDSEGTRTIDFAVVNGHHYTDKAIGSSVIGAIAYAPIFAFTKLTHYQLDLQTIKYLLTFLAIGLPSAIAGSLVYVLCEAISKHRLRAYLATLAITLGTMVLPFSAIYFSHQLAGALLFGSFFMIFQLKQKPSLCHKWGYLFLTGFLLGAAFITEYTSAILILALMLYYVYLVREKWSFRWLGMAILPFALGAIIPLIPMAVYNQLVFGNPLTIGYENLGNQYQASMSQGLLGISWPRLEVLFYLTFHPAEGIFWQSPVLLMAMAGFFFLWRDKRFRAEGVIALFGLIGFLLFNAGYFLWWGGGSFGPRHLIPMLLFLSIPLALVPKRFIPMVILLAVISFGQMLIPLANDMLVPDTYFVQNPHLPFFGYSTIYSSSLPQLMQGKFTYNLGEIILGLKNWTVLIPSILAVLVATGIFIRWDRTQHGREEMPGF
jgi:hypothetical protein